MKKTSELSVSEEVAEFLVFKVYNIVCGLEINNIQEIKKISEITPVHHAPEFVRGVINLRGQIVTVIDVRNRFGFASEHKSELMRIIIVKSGEEFIGLLVDEIEDAVAAEKKNIQVQPANVNGVQGQFFTGVCKMENSLVSILDKDVVLGKK